MIRFENKTDGCRNAKEIGSVQQRKNGFVFLSKQLGIFAH